MTQPTMHATRYEVTCHPDPSSRNHSRYAVVLERRAGGLWSVSHLLDYYTPDGLWSSTDRPAYWRPYRDAFAVARRLASVVEVGGRTAAQSWAWEQSQRAVS